ncbi:Neighbor of COX4 [Termitomyces sp. T112]|nr:Neighbor of COX4 [Termitomyces sp. T112]
MSYTLSATTYFKIFFHAAKHPHKQINGVLLGKKSAGDVIIEDAVPLLHHWTSLSPMMEIGLDLVTQYADSVGLKLVGYYQASDRLDDTSLVPVGEKIAGKIKQGFNDAVAFVIDGDKLGTHEAALIPYTSLSTSSSWRPFSGSPAPFSQNSSFKLALDDLPRRAVALVRDEHRHHKFGDFDDHLEDVSIDWLRNRACIPDAMIHGT